MYITINERYELWIYPENGYDHSVYPGQHLTLRTTGSADYFPLTYQWYQKTAGEEYEPIEGANEKDYITVGGDQDVQYKCRVTDETNNLEAETEFTVYIMTDPAVFADGDTNLTIYPEQEFTMSVQTYGFEATAYEWQRESDGETQTIEGADSNSLTLNDVTEGTHYTCVVTILNEDNEPDTRQTDFYVYIDNQFTAYGEQDNYADATGATLRVIASCMNNTALQYQWYQYIDGERQDIAGATEAVYEAADIYTSNNFYYCEVTDGFGGEENIDFNVNGSAVISCVNIQGDVTVAYGSPATLTAEWASNTGTLTYRWEQDEPIGSWNWVEIEGADGPTLSIPEVREGMYVRCTVNDEYGNYDEVYLNLYCNLEIELGEREQSIDITPYQEFTMTMPVISTNALSALPYTWYRQNADTGEGELLEGETNSTLTVRGLTENCRYICEILSYDYRCYFNIYVSNQLEAHAAGNTDVRVHPDETVNLAVTASCAVDEPTFEWWQDSMVLADETSNQVTLPAEGNNSVWTCRVTDPINPEISTEVSFYVEYTTEPLPNLITRALQLDEPVLTQIEEKYGNTSWFRFVPEESGYYQILSEAGSDMDPAAYLYDDRMILIREDDNGYGDQNFAITVALRGGETYYLRAWEYYNSSNNYPIKVERLEGLYAVPAGRKDVEAPYGESATLTVEAGPDPDNLTYRWGVVVDGLAEEIDGVDGASYVISAVTADATYRCIVSDGRNDCPVDFTVRTVTNLQTIPEQSQSLEMNNDETLALTVSAESEAGGLTYQWFTFAPDVFNPELKNEAPIDNAIESTYLITQPDSRDLYYYCLVEDAAGNTRRVDYYVTVNGVMTLEPVGETVRTIQAGDSVNLKVTPVSAGRHVTYTWTRTVFDANGDEIMSEDYVGEGQEITVEGVSDHTLFTCRATDEFGAGAETSFEIYMANYFAIGRYNREVFLSPGDSLSVTVNAYSDSALSYAWYGPVSKMSIENAPQIAGENRESIIIPNIQECAYYFCRVQDESGNSKDVWYYAHIQNDLSAWTYDGQMWVSAGETSTLQVSNVTSSTDVTYQWYGPVAEQALLNQAALIDGSDGDTYTTDNYLGQHTWYRCSVRDIYGNTENVDFEIIATSDLSVSAAGGEYPETPAGEPLTMQVSAEGSGTKTYQWCTITQNRYNQDIKTLLPDVTGDTYTVVPVYDVRYACRVADTFGGSTEIVFYPRIDNQLTVESIGETSQTIEAGEGISLAVQAGYLDGQIAYQWYEEVVDIFGNYGERKIAGATDATLTIPEVDHTYARYRCIVQDDYGGQEYSETYYIYIDNHLQSDTPEHNYPAARPDEDCVLQVEAECSVGSLTYQWYADGIPVTKAMTDNTEYTVTDLENPEACHSYYCTVRDQYGNELTFNFYISIDNGFSAEYTGTNEPAVAPGGTAEMEVNASCHVGTIAYQWYKLNKYSDDAGNEYSEWEPVEGATEAIYTSDAITEYTQYYCQVQDEYGSQDSIWFYVHVENHLIAEAAESDITVAPNGQAVMTVNASCDIGAITYQWFKYEEYYDENDDWHDSRLIEDATEATCTSEAITQYTQYYCVVRDEYGNSMRADFYVRIENHFTAEAEQDSLTVAPNETATMTVTASCDIGGITYQWYKLNKYIDDEGDEYSEWEPVEGATEATCTSDAITAYTQYYCYVQDEYGSGDNVGFSIYIENHLTAEAAESEITVAPNEQAVMTVNASCDIGAITYQWYKYDPHNDEDGNWYEYRQIEGVTAETYTSEAITQNIQYYCDVKDDYGNSARADFYVSIENHFTADAEQDSLTVAPNETATMTVNASCDIGGITYQWYKLNKYIDDEGDEYSEWEPVEGATEATYTSDAITEYTQYYCQVQDEYGSQDSIWFYVHVENHLIAEAAESDITVAPNGQAVMTVNASCDIGAITYQWFKYEEYYDENDDWHDSRLIEDATEATCTSEAITQYTQYYCVVRDEYGNSMRADFYVRIENHFTAEAEQDSLTVAPNETATMTVTASCDIGGITYQWYKLNKYIDDEGDEYSEWEPVEGATEATCTSDAITAYTQYYCYVQDEYGSGDNVGFSIYIENHLTAEAAESEITVAPNEQAVMTVNASCDIGAITYQWYKYDPHNDEDGNWYEYRQIEGVTAETYTSEAITQNIQYYCDVKDDYGNSARADFYVSIENHFTADAEQDSLTVAPNETATMTVNASCDIGGITYQWYKLNKYIDDEGNERGEWKPVESATGATCTSDAITEYTEYYCNVQDEYGSANDIWFYIYLENHLTAEAAESEITVAPNGQAVMTVNASCDTGAMTYQWYKYDGYYDEDGNWYDSRLIEDATEATYTSEAITQNMHYYCVVRDEFKNATAVDFYVSIENHLTAEGELGSQTVAPNETVTMTVNASCDIGDILYQWYELGTGYDSEGNEYEGWCLIEGETGRTYTSPGITKYTQYYCSVRDEYGNGTNVWFTVYIENHLTAEAVQSEITIVPGEQAIMTVNASCDAGSVSYQWYRYGKCYDEYGDQYYDWIMLEGAINASYTSESITEYTQYRCRVRDEYCNETNVWFTVYTNHFSADAVQNGINVTPYETVTLEVNATCDVGPVSYEWYRSNEHNDSEGNFVYWQTIEDATGATYTFEVTPGCAYNPSVENEINFRCVASDSYGNAKAILFVFYVDNQLTAESDEYRKTIAPHGTATFTVNASCLEGSISYEWTQYGENEDGDWYRIQLDDINGDSCTTEPITYAARVECRVTDQFGNVRYVYFEAEIDNEFVVQNEGVHEETVVPGSDIEMNVEASCRDGEITYQWYELSTTDDGEVWRLIEGAEGSSHTVENIIAPTQYYCLVQDEYGSSRYVFFNFAIDNHLTAEAVQSELEAVPGGKATMEVNASCDAGIITYQWYRYYQHEIDEEGNWSWYDARLIEDAAESVYISDEITERALYYCFVQDEYGNRTTVHFNIIVDNHLTAEAVQKDLTVMPGGTVTMEVNAHCDTGTVTYQWYKYYSHEYIEDHTEWSDSRAIEGATGATYTSEALNDYSYYYCVVRDEFGNEVLVDFFIHIENHLNAEALPEKLVVEPGSEAHMEVTATCDRGDVTYQWYRYLWVDNYEGYWYGAVPEPIEGATYDNLNDVEVTEVTMYMCMVQDQYGNSIAVDFTIALENQFTAEMAQVWQIVEKYTEATLKVNADCEMGSVSYQWYEGQRNEDGTDNWMFHNVQGATEAVYYTGALTDTRQYLCHVWDEYGNDVYLWCMVALENHLTAEAEQENVFVTANEAATMKVTASCDEGPITYQWYIRDGYYDDDGNWIDFRLIEGATEETYTTDPVAEFREYQCAVSDTYGNQIYEYVSVYAVTYDWADDFSTVTATYVTGTGDPVTETVNTTYIVPVSPTDSAEGSAVFTAEFVNPAFETKQTVTIPALGTMDVLTLPGMLTEIDEEAFEGIAAEAVIIPEGCESVGARAFANCKQLKYVLVPAGTSIDDSAFEGCGGVVVDRK